MSLVWPARGSREGSVALYVTEELLSVEVEDREKLWERVNGEQRLHGGQRLIGPPERTASLLVIWR